MGYRRNYDETDTSTSYVPITNHPVMLFVISHLLTVYKNWWNYQLFNGQTKHKSKIITVDADIMRLKNRGSDTQAYHPDYTIKCEAAVRQVEINLPMSSDCCQHSVAPLCQWIQMMNIQLTWKCLSSKFWACADACISVHPSLCDQILD